MERIDVEKYREKKQEILDFLRENQQYYGYFGLVFALLVATDDILEVKALQENTNFSQILSKFGVYQDGFDVYLEMIRLLERYDFLKGHCLEIGAGIYPRLAELMAPKIQLNGGTLTVYDSKILFSNIKNIKVVKEKFTKKTDISNVDTLIGLYPCEATIVMAEKAFEEDKNLLLACCGCDHSTLEHPKWFGDYWAEDFCMDYREKYGKEAEIISFPHLLGEKLPILVRESSKHKEKRLKIK